MTRTEKYVLVIDLGSGGPKVAVVSDSGTVMGSAVERVETILIPGGGAEQDPAQWWDSVKRCVKRAIADSGLDPAEIAMISCDSQWSVIVPVDRNGEPLMRAVHWLDTRGARYNRQISRGFPMVEGYGLGKLITWIRLTGFAPTRSGLDSLGHILYIKNELPRIYEKAHAFLEPMDFITARLTGKITASQHTMITVMSMDNRKWSTCQYHRKLLKLSGVSPDKYPELIPNDGIVGTLLPSVATELGLSPDTRVLAGINDTNASVIGAGGVADFEGVIYIGTSLVLSCHLPFKKTDIFHMMTTLPSPLQMKYLLFAEQGAGGKVLEFFLKNMVYADDLYKTGPIPADAYERADRIAGEVPAGSGGVMFLPWLNGTIVPEENALARGALFNLSLGSHRGHMTRALMEGLAFNSRWTMGPAQKFIGRSFTHLRFAGGGALSDLWAQIHADVLGLPIHQVEDPYHTTIRGAAFLGFHRMGIRPIGDVPGLVKIKRVFHPDPGTMKTYDRLYEQFRAFYKKNKAIFDSMNG